MEVEERKIMALLVGETGADWRTVCKWLRGERVAAVTDYALQQAAAKLSIEVKRDEA